MKFAFSLALLVASASAAFAQQQPAQQSDPKLEATEHMLLDEMTAHRNWYATAIAKDAALQQSQKALADAQTQIVALQTQLNAAKETAAAAKAVPAPLPGK